MCYNMFTSPPWDGEQPMSCLLPRLQSWPSRWRISRAVVEPLFDFTTALYRRLTRWTSHGRADWSGRNGFTLGTSSGVGSFRNTGTNGLFNMWDRWWDSSDRWPTRAFWTTKHRCVKKHQNCSWNKTLKCPCNGFYHFTALKNYRYYSFYYSNYYHAQWRWAYKFWIFITIFIINISKQSFYESRTARQQHTMSYDNWANVTHKCIPRFSAQ